MIKKTLAFALTVAAVAILIGCADVVKVTDDSPIAWKLASIDTGSRTLPRSLATEWEWQLDRLVRKAIDAPSRKEASGVILTSFKAIANGGGPDRDLRSFVRALDASIPSEGVSWVDFQAIALATALVEIDGGMQAIKDATAKRPLEGFRQE